jgi:hypothetical protein
MASATLDSVHDMVISATTDDEGCKILLEAIGTAIVLPANTTLVMLSALWYQIKSLLFKKAFLTYMLEQYFTMMLFGRQFFIS